MLEFTVTVETKANGHAAADAVADRLLDQLLADPAALHVGGIGSERGGRLSSTFQVQAEGTAEAEATAGRVVAAALARAGAPQHVGSITVRPGGPD